MTDNDQKPVGDEDKKDHVGGSSDPKPAQGVTPFRVFATEDDYKAHEAKRSEKFEKELSKLRREYDELKAKHLTDDEKKADLTRQAVEAERKKLLEEADRRAGFLGVALANGLNKDQADKWFQLAGQEWDDPMEAFADVQKALGVTVQGNDKSRPVAGGGGRNPDDGKTISWTPDAVQALMAKEGVSGYLKKRDEIMAWQATHNPITGPRRLIPTQPQKG